MIIFAKNFNNFWEKIWFFLWENVMIFANTIWQSFQENPPTFTGKFNGFSNELRQFLHKSLTVFTGTFDNFSGKLDDFRSKICWFLFLASPRVFYHSNSHPSKIRQILLQRPNILIMSYFQLRITTLADPPFLSQLPITKLVIIIVNIYPPPSVIDHTGCWGGKNCK